MESWITRTKVYFRIYTEEQNRLTPFQNAEIIKKKKKKKKERKNQRTIEVSKDYRTVEVGEISLSPTLSITTRWNRQGRTSLSISNVCISEEVDPSTMFGTEEETTKKKKKKKKSTRGNFSNYGNKLVAVIHHRGKMHKELPFIHHRVKLPCIPQRMKTHKELPLFVEKPRT